MELKRKKNIPGTGTTYRRGWCVLSHNPGNFRLLCTPSEGYVQKLRCKFEYLEYQVPGTQYVSVLNKYIKIDAKKTHTQNGRVLVHYHPRIGETVDIRITPPVLRSSRPVHTAAADFSTQRSLSPHLTNPIFTPVHVQRTGLSTQEPSLTPPQPTPCTEYSVYSSRSLLLGPPTQLRTARQWSLSSTEHAAVTLFVRSIQQSFFFYAAYISHSFST